MISYLRLINSCKDGDEFSMSQTEKLIARFLSKPKDFTFDELKVLLNHFGYELDESGNGSRVKFINKADDDVIFLHKPHPGNIVKSYIIKEVLGKLKNGGKL